jgi:hypothetical protein
MNKEIRESSVDKGWKSMRSMLAVEMPRDNKRRPLLWWWLLAASVAGVISFMRLSVPPNQQKNEPVLQQPVAPAPVASVRQDFQPAVAGAGSLRLNSTDNLKVRDQLKETIQVFYGRVRNGSLHSTKQKRPRPPVITVQIKMARQM